MKSVLASLAAVISLALGAGDPPQARGSAPITVAAPRSAAGSESIRELLELSLKNGKGLMFYLGSQSLGGAVTRIGEQTVEVRNREYSRIVIRLDRIDAVAMN